MSTPHAGELCGPESVRACLDFLGADRIGHGIRAAEDPRLLEQLAARGTTLEVCPSSNVGLGVFPTLGDVPLKELLAAGVPLSLGADDPLLFGSRLLEQYTICRNVFGLDDETLASLARMSIGASNASAAVQAGLLEGIDDWLAGSSEARDTVDARSRSDPKQAV
jgi:adenosine deaminase